MNIHIFHYLNNSPLFIRVVIKDGKAESEMDSVTKDINTKLKTAEIQNMTFFVYKGDYVPKFESYIWEQIKELPFELLPIYRKKDPLLVFVEKYIVIVNQVAVYETRKYEKRDKYIYFNLNECKKEMDWVQTNPKHQHFNQFIYHASDMNDIERYGLLPVMSHYARNIKKAPLLTKRNIFYEHPIKLWERFGTDVSSIKATLFYVFYKFKKGVLVSIKDNKLAVYLPFSNAAYKNDYITEMYFDDDDKKLIEKYVKGGGTDEALLGKMKDNVRAFFKSKGMSTNGIHLDRRKWLPNNCFFRYETFEGDKSVVMYQDMLLELCKARDLPDSLFVINLRDHPIMHVDRKDPYVDLIDRDLDEKYMHDKYLPIFSIGPSKITADIPLPTQDDWSRVSQKAYIDKCVNPYLELGDLWTSWEAKMPKCVFRGSATGCSIDAGGNVRLKAYELGQKHPDLLDVGITSFNRKSKKTLGKPINVIEPTFEKSVFMSHDEKTKYKYVLYLDGHVGAFRLGHELSLGSVVLIPESRFTLWFTHLLVPYEHYVPVDAMLDNLVEKINWCKNNDDKCKKISENARKFYDKYLTKDAVFDYMQRVLCQLSFDTIGRQVFNKRIVLITIYRDDKEHTRFREQQLFMYYMNRLLYGNDYMILTVEQSKDWEFNIGKLKNIGFDYLEKKGLQFDNYIFTDIDMIPSTGLLPYYFKTTKSINGLALKGTRYAMNDLKTRYPFVGGVMSCTRDVFIKLNGYPNNYYGWGDEDSSILLRMKMEGMDLFVPKKGHIIDLEEKLGGLGAKSVQEKTSELVEKEGMKYEKTYNYKDYKSNGLNTLIYKIIEERHNYIVVDLEKEKSIKQNPHLYNYEPVTKEQYIKVKDSNIRTIRRVYF
jgi:hypothetical protein